MVSNISQNGFLNLSVLLILSSKSSSPFIRISTLKYILYSFFGGFLFFPFFRMVPLSLSLPSDSESDDFFFFGFLPILLPLRPLPYPSSESLSLSLSSPLFPLLFLPFLFPFFRVNIR